MNTPRMVFLTEKNLFTSKCLDGVFEKYDNPRVSVQNGHACCFSFMNNWFKFSCLIGEDMRLALEHRRF